MTFNALGVTVMISGPSDTTAEVDAVRAAIGRWNARHSQSEGVIFIAKHYSTDSVPLYLKGQDGQSVINDQITSKSDVVVVLFKHRLGTPTLRNEHSGTVEEADLRAPDSPVHFYFWDAKTIPAEIVNDRTGALEQWHNLSDFRGKFHENESGSYAMFTDLQHLCSQVEDALLTDARKFAASRVTSTQAPMTVAPAKIVLTVDVRGGVWRAPGVKDLVERMIDIELQDEYKRKADRPLRLSETEERLTKWKADIRNDMETFDEHVAAAAAAPITVEVKSDGIIEGLEIEITFEDVFGLDPTGESWKEIWTPLRVPSTENVLINYGMAPMPPIDTRGLGSTRSEWAYDSDGVLILTLELDEIRKRRVPDVFDDSVILALPYDSDAVSEVKYAWNATARNTDAEWSGTGMISVLSEESTRQRIVEWLEAPGRD
ncbi:hypothetical protein RQCS_00380 [Rhodococcus qingshengii]|uniref:hypothetical protein n=1 Tax=Rhodococcus qingshengii TaxID=334542 RepID=UPI0007E571FD|nr:hypothetical protein [Rhodococcus qingshengii]BCF80493.1 hypothetical protein RQCS_00380 [Rhodococcus qingshengii]